MICINEGSLREATVTVPVEEVKAFMDKHYTSTRVKMLVDILKKYNIKI